MVRGDSATSGNQNSSSQADSPFYPETTLSIETVISEYWNLHLFYKRFL